MPNNKGGKKYKRNKNVAQENKTTRLRKMKMNHKNMHKLQKHLVIVVLK